MAYNPYNNYGYYPQQNNYPNYNNYGYQAPQMHQVNQSFMRLSFVNGIEEARAYILEPNTSIYLRDSNANKLYIKSCDNTGISTIDEYDLIKSTENKANFNENVDVGQFITKDDFNALKKEINGKINALKKELGGKDEQ